MFAKLRAGSGRDSRSWLPTTPPCTALAVSIVSVVIEEEIPSTFTVSRPLASLSVTARSRTTLTATSTSAVASAKPLAVTVTRYDPGSSPSMRNSPRSLAVASRVKDAPCDCTTTRAPATRAALASCTSPRSAPFGFCACNRPGTANDRKIRTPARMTAERGDIVLRILAAEKRKRMYRPSIRRKGWRCQTCPKDLLNDGVD